MYRKSFIALYLILMSQALLAQQDSKPMLIQRVSISQDKIAFSYAGEIWLMPREGGEARQLTNHPGDEDFPVFSPDGNQLAFSRRVGDNSDVCVMPTQGGKAIRLTFYPKSDYPCGWTPDSRKILFVSGRDGDGFRRLYSISSQGVFPEPLPLPMASEGCYSPDGRRLVYVPKALGTDIMNWPHYRGGLTSPLWIVNLDDLGIKEVTDDSSNARFPMWIGENIYFLSDRTGIFNLYVYDTKTQEIRPLTSFDSVGIKNAASNRDAIVFIREGRIYLYDLKTGEINPVNIRVSPDISELKRRTAKAAQWIQTAHISPQGDMVVFAARGEALTFDPKTGNSLNITQTPGIAERNPTFSPDGMRIAYFSDESGEYELHVRSVIGDYSVTKIKIEENPSFYRELTWSPDSSKIAFSDIRLALWLVDVNARETEKIDVSPYIAQGRYYPSWSIDSRYLAYAKALQNRLRTVFIYDAEHDRIHQITDGRVHAEFPIFDQSGRYLYFSASSNARRAAASDIGWGLLSSRLARPLVSKTLHALVLSNGQPPPIIPTLKRAHPQKPWNEPLSEVQIDFEDLERRIVQIPIEPHDYAGLALGKPGIIYLFISKWPMTPGATGYVPTALYKLDLQKPTRIEKFYDDISGFSISHDKRKILYGRGATWVISDADRPIQPMEGRLDLKSLEVTLNPQFEWKQMYHEAWRLMRDYFYDPNHHGYDIQELEKHFSSYLPSVTRRSDLNLLFREMLGFLSVSHLSVAGGDIPRNKKPPKRVGVLGADFEIDGGFYRIRRIYRSGHFTSTNPLMRGPLDQPGMDVREGDYLLAVDKEPVDSSRNVFSYFEGKDHRPVKITVASKPDDSDKRTYTVVPHIGAGALRKMNWAEKNRRIVEKLSGGKLAYIYIRNYGGGVEDFIRGILGSTDKKGLIIDQRYNGGGTTSDSLIEDLKRERIYYYAYRHGEDYPVPPVTFPGPKVLVINEWDFSAAETFAMMFKLTEVGMIVGKRTAGGGIGTALFYPRLIDDGRIRIPNRAAYNPTGSWDIENHGVTPHFEAGFPPKDWIEGRDPQLEKAIEIAFRAIEKRSPKTHIRPNYPVYKK
ncbi:MAG: PD40 domain-containing protein [Candidatus Aminicenantes bacterium]|nr:MAG: PD40 domain-containing protein [Candidatus Aminicenantes bacterium]